MFCDSLTRPTEKYLFDHIPRSGGTYFASLLSDLLGPTTENFDCGPDYPASHQQQILELDRYRVVAGHLRLETIKAFGRVRPRRRISMVRDPIAQIASSYQFWRHTVLEDLPHCNLAKTLSFSDFIRRSDLRMAVENPMTRHYFGIWDPNVLEPTETVKRLATKMAESYDFVGVTERMDESVQALSKLFPTRVKMTTLPAYPRNESKGKVQISTEDQNYLRHQNEIDFAIYEYANTRLDQILYGSTATSHPTPKLSTPYQDLFTVH